MKKISHFVSKVASAALLSTLAVVGLTLPTTAQADNTIKSGPEVNEISQATTLLIVGVHSSGNRSSNGSDSLISKVGNECVGLTNRHVIDKDPVE